MRPRSPVLAALLAPLLLVGGLAAVPPAPESVGPPAVEAAKRDRRPERRAPATPAPALAEPDAEPVGAARTGTSPAADAGEGSTRQQAGKRKRTPKCFGKRATIRAKGDAPVALTTGNDTVIGDGAANEVEGSAGLDRVCGGGGDDRIDGRAEADSRRLLARGGDGDDTLLGTDGDDRLVGDAGADDLGGFLGRNELLGGAGDDFLASSGNDRLDGGPGNDILNADNEFADIPGADVLIGGDGDDTIRAADGAFDLVDCGKGVDTVEFDPGLDQISANCETLTPIP